MVEGMTTYSVRDELGNTFEVHKTERNTIMLCGEWQCLEMSRDTYFTRLSSNQYQPI